MRHDYPLPGFKSHGAQQLNPIGQSFQSHSSNQLSGDGVMTEGVLIGNWIY
jgi:hypothetical protein